MAADTTTTSDDFTDLMAEGKPLKGLADLMMWWDEYDRRARFAPAALVVAPLAVATFALQAEWYNWFIGIGLAAFVQVTMTSMVAHVGRSSGTLMERRIRNSGDMPIQRWLCPYNQEHSKSQKALWQAAVKHVTGIDYETGGASCYEYGRLGRDTFVALQQALRVNDDDPDSPKRPLYRIQQEEYGFIRNLVGLRTLWGLTLTVGFLTTAYAASQAKGSWTLVVVEVLLAVCWAAIMLKKDFFEMTGAERLSESLLNAASAKLRTDLLTKPIEPNAVALPEPQAPRRDCAECGARWSVKSTP